MLFDLIYTIRRLWTGKWISGAIALTLAICIGINAIIFSLLYALVLRPMPFFRSDRLVEIYNSYPKIGLPKYAGNVAQYLDYVRHPELFSGIGLFWPGAVFIGSPAGQLHLPTARVTPSFFDVLQLRPVVGRFFDANATIPGQDHVIVLTHSFWQSHFNGDPGVVGQKLETKDGIFTIVGVAPQAAEYFEPVITLFTPLSWPASQLNGMSRATKDPNFVGRIFARLASGVTISQAAERTAAIDRGYYDIASAAYRQYVDKAGYRSVVHSLHDEQIASWQGTPNLKANLYLLQCGALFVLLIGCLNVANLLLARATARLGEMALRHALGGSLWRIARQLILESALLSFLGGVLSLVLSLGGVGLANHYAGDLLPYGVQVKLDGAMMAFAAAISLGTTLITSLLPVHQLVRRSLVAGIQQRSRSTSRGRGGRAFGFLFASSQIALSLVLLTGTGLLVRSLAKVLAVPIGMDVSQLTTVRTAFPRAAFQHPENVYGMQDRIAATLQTIPGVESVGLATETPMTDGYKIATLFVRGAGGPAEAARPVTYYMGVSPDFFSTMGVPLLSGRKFDARDTSASAPVAIVDRQFVRRYFPGGEAIGQRVAFEHMPTDDGGWITIVGVAEITRYTGADDEKGMPFLYLPFRQYQSPGTSIFVRSRRPAAELIPVMRQRILALDPTLPVYYAASMEQYAKWSLGSRTSSLSLLGAFAFVALLLSAIGIYAVLAYDVAQRSREIGIRGALGASRQQIVSLILGQGLRQIAFGLAAGLIGALLLSHLMAGLLFQIDPNDPPTLVGISGLLLAIGLLASFFPAWRAARIDPVIALRAE